MVDSWIYPWSLKGGIMFLRLLFLLITVCFATSCQNRELPLIMAVSDINATSHSDKAVRAQGTVKRGIEIGTDYYVQSCSYPIFLQDDSGAIQIKVRTEDGSHTSSPLEEYLGKAVEVMGDYTVLSCSAICDCDGYISIQSITLLEDGSLGE
jgi:hypothetical protein